MTIAKQMITTDVKKPTSLIHYRRVLPLASQKILTALAIHAQFCEPDDKGNRWISERFLADLIGWSDSNNLSFNERKREERRRRGIVDDERTLYDYFLMLYHYDVEYNVFGTDRTIDEDEELSKRFLIGKGRRKGMIGYEIHPHFEKRIKNPNLYAKLKVVMMGVLAEPKYAYPLYELGADIASRGVCYQDFDLEPFRSYLAATGRTYDDYIQLRKKVIRPAEKLVNEKSEYNIRCDTIRSGRRVTGIRMYAERKKEFQLSFIFDAPLELLQKYVEDGRGIERAKITSQPLCTDEAFCELLKPLARYDVSADIVRDAVIRFGIADTIQIRDYALSRVIKDGRIPQDKHSGYIATCFRKGHGRKTPEQRAKEEAQQADKEQNGKRNVARATLEAIRRTVKSRRAAAVNDRVEAAKQDAAILAEFKASPVMQSPHFQKQLEAGSWKGLQTPFINFIAAKYLGAEIDALRAYAKERGHDYEKLVKEAE